jgi:Fur family transcriptional regulator, zinc uptake regulator
MREASRRAVALLRQSDVPLNTYDILRRLNADGMALRPPQAYRIVERLTRERLIHRVESQGGFIACRMQCGRGTGGGETQLLVCTACGAVSEIRIRKIDALLTQIGARRGFQPHRRIVEILGTCKACQPRS